MEKTHSVNAQQVYEVISRKRTPVQAVVNYFHIFFFKQKTAYELRISDWSSDVCSSYLKWEPNQVFYDQLSKATLLKLLAEGCGNDAVENCQTMKRSDLAVTVNERLAGRRILPPALRPSALPDAADSESQAA